MNNPLQNDLATRVHDLAAENARLREHDEAVRKAFAKLAVALDASVRDEFAQRGHLRDLAAENARLREENARLREGMKDLIAAYVRTLEAARDHVVALGVSCNPVDVMEAADPALRAARTVIGETHAQAPFDHEGARR